MEIAVKAERAMEEARAGLVSSHPSLGYLSFKLRWFADATCKTAWVDGVSVGFNPEFVMSLTRGQRKFLAAHEVGHPMLGHHLRRGDRDPQLWNEAGDYVLNWMLMEGNFDLIESCLIDSKFALMAVEEAYNYLLNERGNKEEDKGGDKGDNDGTEESSGSSDGDSGGGQQQPGPDKGTEDGSGTGSGSGDDSSSEDQEPGKSGEQADQDAQDSTGKSSGGPEGNSQEADNDPGGCGEVRDYPGDSGEATQDEIEAEAEKWDIAVQQAAQIARKLQGEVPGFVETVLNDISDPKLPWNEILARWVSQKVKDDYNFGKPNPRYASTGFFMPALESQDLGKVALFWDTSCSVTDDQVADIAAETQGLLACHPGVSIDLYHIDTDVRHIEPLDQYTKWDHISAKGRGGTDFRPGFYAVEDSEEEAPVGIIYMTDGECSKFPDEPPSIPVLWIIIDMPHHRRFVPPFGEVAYYDDYNF